MEKLSSELGRLVKEHEVELQVANAKTRASEAAFRLLQRDMKKLREQCMEVDFLRDKNKELETTIAELSSRPAPALATPAHLTSANTTSEPRRSRKSLVLVDLGGHVATADGPTSPTKEAVPLRARLSSLSMRAPRRTSLSEAPAHPGDTPILRTSGAFDAVGFDMLKSEIEELRKKHQEDTNQLRVQHKLDMVRLGNEQREKVAGLTLDAECAIVQALGSQRQLEEQVTINTRLEQHVRGLNEQIRALGTSLEKAKAYMDRKPSLFSFRTKSRKERSVDEPSHAPAVNASSTNTAQASAPPPSTVAAVVAPSSQPTDAAAPPSDGHAPLERAEVSPAHASSEDGHWEEVDVGHVDEPAADTVRMPLAQADKAEKKKTFSLKNMFARKSHESPEVAEVAEHTTL